MNSPNAGDEAIVIINIDLPQMRWPLGRAKWGPWFRIGSHSNAIALGRFIDFQTGVNHATNLVRNC
jgi:hypothetical protein